MRDRIYALTLLDGPRDYLRLAQICLLAAAVPLLTRLPLPRLAALITRPVRRREPRPGEVERLARVMELAPRIAHPLVRTGCLTRGLTLYWLLRRTGVNVELRFGLDLGAEAAPDGHCWLALEDEPFLEPEGRPDRFAELYRLPLVSAG